MTLIRAAGFSVPKIQRDQHDWYAVAVDLREGVFAVISNPVASAPSNSVGEEGWVILKFPQGYNNPAIVFLRWDTISHSWRTWTSTKSVTARCGIGTYGVPYVGTNTYTSAISQADADAHALLAATNAAYAGLSCAALVTPLKVQTWTYNILADVVLFYLLDPVHEVTVRLYRGGVVLEERVDDGIGGPVRFLYTDPGIYWVDLWLTDDGYETHITSSQIQVPWISTQSYTAVCPAGSHGDSVTQSVTLTSLVSQADADANALEAARLAAYAELSCSADVPLMISALSISNPGGTFTWSIDPPDAISYQVYVDGVLQESGTAGPSYGGDTAIGFYGPGSYRVDAWVTTAGYGSHTSRTNSYP